VKSQDVYREKIAYRLARNRIGKEPYALHAQTRMDAAELERLDRENALIELGDIIARVRAMADISYDMALERSGSVSIFGLPGVMLMPQSY
jgi:hypothetical protein